MSLRCEGCGEPIEFEEDAAIGACPLSQNCEGCGRWFHPAGITLPGGALDHDGGERCAGCLSFYCGECFNADGGHEARCAEYRDMVETGRAEGREDYRLHFPDDRDQT